MSQTVSVIPDKDGEKFLPSSCNCQVCLAMNTAQVEWDTFIPSTNLQRRMMAVVSNIETRVKKGHTSSIRTIPKRLRPKHKLAK